MEEHESNNNFKRYLKNHRQRLSNEMLGEMLSPLDGAWFAAKVWNRRLGWVPKTAPKETVDLLRKAEEAILKACEYVVDGMDAFLSEHPDCNPEIPEG